MHAPHSKSIQRVTRLLLTCLIVTSCGVFSPTLTSPNSQIPIPDSWSTRLTSGTTAHSWVKKFKDPLLTNIVQEVLKNNNDLQAAAKSIEQLKESELITKLGQRPRINLGSGATTSGDFAGEIDDARFNLSFNSRWEIDLWGRLKAQREQASANSAAAQADFYAAKLSLAGNTTSAYFNLISAQNSLELANTILENFEKSFKVIESNYKAGVPGVDA